MKFHEGGLGKAPLYQGSPQSRKLAAVGQTKVCSSNRPCFTWWGRFPLGVSFERAKETKTRLGRSPLRTSLGVPVWNCVKSRFGPGPGEVTWMAWQVYRKCSLLCETVPLLPGPYPGQRRSLRRKPGPRQQKCSHSSHFFPCLSLFWSTRPSVVGKRPHTATLEALAMEEKAVSGAGTLQRCDTPSM